MVERGGKLRAPVGAAESWQRTRENHAPEFDGDARRISISLFAVRFANVL